MIISEKNHSTQLTSFIVNKCYGQNVIKQAVANF